MITIDEEKLARLETANDYLDEKYGKDGTPMRECFNEQAQAWYHGEIRRNRRKSLAPSYA